MSKISIATLKDGVAVKMVDDALTDAWQNVMDPMVPAIKKREVTLKITLIPNDTRDDVAMLIDCATKFPAKKGEAVRVAMAWDSDGAATAVEYKSPQLEFPDQDNVATIDKWHKKEQN